MALSWTLRKSGLGVTPPNGCFCKDSNGYIYLAAGTHIYKSIDNGINWIDKGVVGTGNALGGISVIGNTIYAAFSGGAYIILIYKSIDGGDNWSQISSQPTTEYNHNLFIVDNVYYNRLYVTIKDPSYPYKHYIALYSDDGGDSWSPTNAPDNNAEYYKLAVNKNGYTVAVSPSGSATDFFGSSDGVSFSSIAGNQVDITSIELRSFDENFYEIGTSDSKFYYSTDNGLTVNLSSEFPANMSGANALFRLYIYLGIMYVCGGEFTGGTTSHATVYASDLIGSSESIETLGGIDDIEYGTWNYTKDIIISGGTIIIVTYNNKVYTAPLPAPDPPTISAEGVVDGVDLTWGDVVGTLTYNLYWSTTSGVTQATGTKIEGVTSIYNHITPTVEELYYYVITAVGPGGESIDSNEVSATPTTMSLEANGISYDTIRITWNTISGATSYKLYWSLTPGVTVYDNEITDILTTSYDHIGRIPGILYYYRVIGVTPEGDTELSNEDSGFCSFDTKPFIKMLWQLLPKGRFWQK